MGLTDKKMSRKEFLQKCAGFVVALSLLGRVQNVRAAGMTFDDNVSESLHVGDKAPSSVRMLWIDTSEGGVAKYYDGGGWSPVKAVWG